MGGLPPRGTRGAEIPGWVMAMLKPLSGLEEVMFRRGIKVQKRPLLKLFTIGARSGERRQTFLGWFPDGEAWVVVGSNSGSARHPGWAFNLDANPDASIDLGDGEVPVRAEIMTGPDRDRMWTRIVEISPGYGKYEEKTDRQIPLFRLTRRSR